MIEINAIANTTEIVCDRCGSRSDKDMANDRKLCLSCGGNLVCVRISRNAVTGRILCAERIKL
ncbi:MAG TPA: hypothetical protein VK436_11675 [Methanocella sp.]|nr:hypothetical protein [Methanocella sp.]